MHAAMGWLAATVISLRVGLAAGDSPPASQEEENVLVLTGKVVLTRSAFKGSPEELDANMQRLRDSMIAGMPAGHLTDAQMRRIDETIAQTREREEKSSQTADTFVYWERGRQTGLMTRRTSGTTVIQTFELLQDGDQITLHLPGNHIRIEKNPPDRVDLTELFHRYVHFMEDEGARRLASLRGAGIESVEDGRIINTRLTGPTEERLVREKQTGTVEEWYEIFPATRQSERYTFGNYVQAGNLWVAKSVMYEFTSPKAWYSRMLLVEQVVTGKEALALIPDMKLEYMEVDDKRFDRPLRYHALGYLPTARQAATFAENPAALEKYEREVEKLWKKIQPK